MQPSEFGTIMLPLKSRTKNFLSTEKLSFEAMSAAMTTNVFQACASAVYETSFVCPPKRLLNVQMFLSKAK